MSKPITARAQSAQVLRQMREGAGLTQSQLSRKLGTVQPNVSRAERVGCSLLFLDKAAKACKHEIIIKIKIKT